jgi:pyrophosphatase PpaX
MGKSALKINTLLFDMDGTLVDSMRVHSLALSAVLHDYLGLDKEPGELSKIIAGRLTRETLVFFTAERLDELGRAWYEYEVPLRDQLKLFPGLSQALAALASRGIRLGVVTSQSRKEMQIMREIVGLDGLMKVWVSSDEVARAKPAPDPVLHAMKMLGSRPEETLMIGDTTYDLLAGRSAGVFTGAAGWNPDTPASIEGLQPDFYFSKPEEMLDLVEGEFSKNTL